MTSLQSLSDELIFKLYDLLNTEKDCKYIINLLISSKFFKTPKLCLKPLILTPNILYSLLLYNNTNNTNNTFNINLVIKRPICYKLSLDTIGNKLINFDYITSLELNNITMVALPALPSTLKELSIKECSELTDLSTISHLNLVKLCISTIKSKNEIYLNIHFNNPETLEVLELRMCGVNIVNLSKCINLHTLICLCKVTDTFLKELGDNYITNSKILTFNPIFTKLHTLHINTIMDIESINICTLPQLINFNIDHWYVIKEIICDNSRLKNVNLAGCDDLSNNNILTLLKTATFADISGLGILQTQIKDINPKITLKTDSLVRTKGIRNFQDFAF